MNMRVNIESWAAACLLATAITGCVKKPPSPPMPVAVTAVKPTLCDTALYLDYVGHIEPITKIEVRSQVEGVITGQYFIEGREVSQGDLLFTIDSRPFVSALQKAEATLALNLATLRYAKETALRYSKLVEDDFVAQLDYDQYLTNVLVDEATISENLADIETARINLDYCSIRSPIAGIVGITQIDEGNLIENAGKTPLVTINQISPINANFYIPEKDLPRIQGLQEKSPLQVHIFLNHDLAHPFVGHLTNIDNQVDETTGTIFLKATLPNSDKALWPGEFVDVRVFLEKQIGGLLLPSQAVQIGQQGPYVYVIEDDDTVRLQQVVQAQRMGDHILIQKGLKSDETVVLDGQLNLRPGSRVSIQPLEEKSRP
ncbi:MAG: efflux RND transporter periplasmic adaptor subunit [Anaerolineae bacterium]